ncbi:MAG: trigger factor [Bacteroidota bacterium]
MNITQESTGNLTANITVLLSPEDYKPQVTEELKKQAKKASMPGFRPGKVPFGLVRKMVGMPVLIEEVNKIVSKALSDYLRDEEISLLGDPMPNTQKTEDDFDVNCEKELDFVFEVGLAPQFDVDFKLNKKPTKYNISIDDAFLKEQIDNFLERFGDVTNPEEVAKGDIMYGRIHEVDGEGNVVEGGFDKMIALNPDRVESKSFFKPYIGNKVDEVFDIDIFKIAKKHADVAEVLFMQEDELKELKGKPLKMELKKINRVEAAEMNEEFFGKVAASLQWMPDEGETELKIETEEAFKARMVKQLEKEFDENSKWYYRNEVQKGLMEGNKVDLPDDFLKRWMLKTQEEYTEERVESEYEDFSKSVTWSMIVENISKTEDIKVEEEDLKDSIRDFVRKNLPAMGDDGESREEEYINYIMQNQEMLEQHYRRIRDEKLYDVLEEKVGSKSGKITASKFVEMSKEENDK